MSSNKNNEATTTTTTNMQETPKKRGRGRPKKAKHAPRRPLSAYNLFFRSERERLRKVIQEGEAPEDYTRNVQEALRRVKGKNSAAEFQAIASTIAKRWKDLPAEDRKQYEKLAEGEMEQYKEKKFEYHRTLVRECEDAAKVATHKEGIASAMGVIEPRQVVVPSPRPDTAPDASAFLGAFPHAASAAATNTSPLMMSLPQRALLANQNALAGASLAGHCLPLPNMQPGRQFMQGQGAPFLDEQMLGQDLALSQALLLARKKQQQARSELGEASRLHHAQSALQQCDNDIYALEMRILQERHRLLAQQEEKERLERQVALLGHRSVAPMDEKEWLGRRMAMLGQQQQAAALLPSDEDIRMEQVRLEAALRARLNNDTNQQCNK